MSLEIFKDEPIGSFEQKIVAGSQESVAQLEEWVNTVCTSLWSTWWNPVIGRILFITGNVSEMIIMNHDCTL